MYRRVFSLAVPNIISNITIPLVGMVDLAIAGALDGLGGVAIGTAIFNLLYWNFGFLRMGTSGLTAQAYGRRDFLEIPHILIRAVVVAIGISLVIVALQLPIKWAAMEFMQGSSEVEQTAADYFFVRIWAAPATLSLYAFKGWLIGMQNSRTPMWIAIVINAVNVVASLLCAFTFQMGVAGVALGTVIAQWSGVVMALICVSYYYGRLFEWRRLFSGIFIKTKFREFFVLNRDIFIRTICLAWVFTYFTQASSTMGDTTLAANTLLLQLFTLFSYFMDGFAYAGEALSGRYFGAGNRSMLRLTVRSIFVIGGGVSVLFAALYFAFGSYVMLIFSPDPSVVSRAAEFMPYAVAVPVVSFAAFLMDGILVGMTHAKIMRNAMLVATALFFGIYLSLRDILLADALWIAFLAYLLVRGLFQWLLARHLFRL